MKKTVRPVTPVAHKKPRKRGAQPGRAREPQATVVHPSCTGHQDNAVTHGFYSSLFKDRERELLSKVPLTDLSAEIGLIRITTKRFLETLVGSTDRLDLETQLSALRAINLSAHSIATLLRAHSLAVEEPDAFPGQSPETLNSDALHALDPLDAADGDPSPDPDS